MAKLNFCRCFILQFYPTSEICRNLMHKKNIYFTVVVYFVYFGSEVANNRFHSVPSLKIAMLL